jgi:N,N'-diacetyllegionaminate synthase
VSQVSYDKSLIIAEIGLSHEGSLGFALRFIESAKACGADVVKFQTHFPEYESSNDETFRIALTVQDKTRWDYWHRTSFSVEEWKVLIRHANNIGVGFCTSVFSSHAVEVMIDNGVKMLKLGSGDLTNLELAESLEGWGGELIVSTGLSTYAEIDSAINRYSSFKKDGRLSVLQCTSKYPTPMNQVGLNNMIKFREQYGVKVGLSDHSVGINASVAAITLGANVIEKHVTFSNRMFGPDVSASITFEELLALTKYRDDLVTILTPSNKDELASSLHHERLLFGRSLGIKADFNVGQHLTLNDFCLRKPAGGLSWNHRQSLVGKRAKRPIARGEIIAETDFE